MKRIQNLLGLLMGMAALPAMAQTVNITVSSDRLHTITGFGAAAMSGPMAPINDVSVIDKLYGPDSEVGLNILRMEVSPNTIGDVTTPWDTPYDWHGFLPAVKRARQYGAIIFAAPWSPPASFKTNNSARGQLADGIIGKLRRDKYKDFFPWLNTFMRYMRNNGAPVDVVSIQNEPDWHPDYSGCYYTPQELDTLVREYGSRFDKSSGVKLMSGEALGYTPNYYAPTLNDPEARQYIDLLGGHTYGHAPFKYMKHAAAMAAPYGIGAWMTEHIVDPRADTDGDSQSDTKVRDLPTWHEQLLFAEDVNETMLAGGSAYVYWYMVSHYSFIGSGETTIQPGNTYGKVLDRGRIMWQFARHLVGATMLDRNSSINKEAQTFESSSMPLTRCHAPSRSISYCPIKQSPASASPLPRAILASPRHCLSRLPPSGSVFLFRHAASPRSFSASTVLPQASRSQSVCRAWSTMRGTICRASVWPAHSAAYTSIKDIK